MRLSTKRRASGDDVRKVVLAALATALDDRKEEAKKKPGLTGVRAVATGAVIYTAGRAAFSGGRFIKDRFGSDGRPDDDDRSEDEEYEDEEYDDEPRAEEDEEPEDEEYDDEPRAEEDEEPEDEEYDEEPRAEEDEEPEDEEYEDEPRAEEDEEPEDEEYEDEPRAEEDEEPEDEEYEDEPRAEEEDEPEDEDYEEPEAEEDEDDYEEESPRRRSRGSHGRAGDRRRTPSASPRTRRSRSSRAAQVVHDPPSGRRMNMSSWPGTGRISPRRELCEAGATGPRSGDRPDMTSG